MLLLDTNVISELRKAGKGKGDVNVIAWLSNVDADTLFISAITLKEIELGVLRKERSDPAQGRVLRRWVKHYVLPEFSGRILPVDENVALRCARLHVPNPRPEADCLIAATALVHDMTVVTRNIADFTPMRVPVLNPWDQS